MRTGPATPAATVRPAVTKAGASGHRRRGGTGRPGVLATEWPREMLPGRAAAYSLLTDKCPKVHRDPRIEP
jgi:hypothetical protein